ncbi:MAG: N-acetylmuramoyl-L-alanine amidase [Eubacteriales bacterium]|nr:N-acetylmuramoyl-L-alanine amidase [Eubacteriales bacterium]
MKRFIRYLAVFLVFCMVGSAVPVSAMLTKEEQEYYKKRKEEQDKEQTVRTSGGAVVTEPVREMVTSSGVHVEIEDLNPTAQGNDLSAADATELQTETATETEQTNQETESEALPVQETEAETTSETESDAASAQETETETELLTESETETEADAEQGDGPLVAIDPGHQSCAVDLSAMEPNGPGSDKMKACYTEGTKGVESGLAEYELNLVIAQKLKKELEKRGYRVLLTRETNDVEISESQRSQKANEAGADIYIRLHANSDEDSERKGAVTGAPSSENPYLQDIYNSCIKLADDILNEYCETTGLDSRGIWITDNLTGSNWSEMPVTLLEMGYMTNPEEDAYMADEANQDTMVEGIANGVDRYFGR